MCDWCRRLVTQRSNDSTCITSGYSVYVKNLPIDATEGEVRRHFSDLFQVSCAAPATVTSTSMWTSTLLGHSSCRQPVEHLLPAFCESLRAQLADPDWEFPGHFGCCCRKKSRLPQDMEDSGELPNSGDIIAQADPVDPCLPVADVSNTQDDLYLGSWVCEVSVIHQGATRTSRPSKWL